MLRIISMRSKLEDFIQKIYPRGTNKKTNEILYGKPEKMLYLDALSEIVSSRDERFVVTISLKWFVFG